MNNTPSKPVPGIGFFGAMFLIFLTLKLCGVIAWSWWWVANLTDDTLGIYNVVRVEVPGAFGDLLSSYHNSELVLHAKKPQEDETVFAVTLGYTDEDGIVPAKMSGTVAVTVDVTNTEHECATTLDEETGYLVSSQAGYARLLSKPIKTGKQSCIVLLGATPEKEQYAIVEEEIGRPDDLEDEPPSNMGKIRIIGKKYGEDEYDDCGCLELCETEKLWNEQVKVIGPFSYEDGDKKKLYYLAIETPGVYYTKLDEELTYEGESKVTITKRDEDQIFTVHDAVLVRGQKYEKDDPVTVARSGDELVVIDGNCPSLEEDEEA